MARSDATPEPPGTTEAAASRPGRMSALALSLRRRVARLSLAGIPAPVAVLTAVGWALTAALLVLVAVPGLVESVFVWTVDPPSPSWFRVLLLAASGAVAAGAVAACVLRDRRESPRPGRVIVRDAAVGIAGAGVGLLLLASDSTAPGVVALGATAATLVLLHVRRSPLGPHVVVAGTAAGAPWWAAGVAQLVPPDDGLLAWLWIVLLPVAGGLAAFGALYGIARGAESRTDGIRRVVREDVPLPLLGAVAIAAIGIVVLRYTVLAGLFGDLDGQMWRLAPSWSWVHAGLVAILVVGAAVRTVRRPLTRVGRRASTAVFAGAAAIQLVFLGPLILVITVTAIIAGTGVDLSDPVIAAAPWISLVLVATWAIVVAHPVFRGSTGRWMTWIGVFYLLPGALASAAGPAFDDLPSFWAKPPQVVALTIVAAAVLLVIGAVRRSRAVPRRVLLRLLLIPLIAVHATALLPAPWESTLGRAVLVIGVVAGAVLLAPRRTSDPWNRGRRLLAHATAALAALVVFVLAVPSVLSTDTFAIVGTLWLAVPMAAVLCLTVVPRSDPPPAGTPPELVDAADADDLGREPRSAVEK